MQKSSDIFRLDSFFFCKEFILDEKTIKGKQYKTFKDLGATLRSFGAYSLNNDIEYQSSGIPFIRGVNLKKGLIDFNDLMYINSQAHKLLWKSEVVPETLLLSMSGTIGDVAIALPSYQYPINSNQDIAKISLHKNGNPYYIYSFLRGRFGQNYLRREARGSVQQHVFLSQMELFKIPILQESFQKQIEFITKKGFKGFELSRNNYTQAEKLLLNELGLNNWQPSAENTNTKSFKKSFSSTGRLDAEYYQPKYELLLTHLKQFDTKKLGLIVKIQKSIEPGSEAYQDKGIPFIRVSNLSKFGITDTEIHLNKEEYQSFTPKPKKDTILLTKDGSVGIAFKVENDLDVVTSSALLHLTVADDEFLPDYLTLVLNSIVVKLQAERDADGSIIQHWKPSEIEQIVIPKLPISKQHLLAEKIQKSFKLKHQSEHLLEVAKHAVEIAIEQDEKAAIQYIQQNTKEV